MIEQIFETLFVFVDWLIKTSFKASLLVCVILIFQFLMRNKISARWRYTLWFLLLIRLLIPFEFVGDLSLHNLLSSVKMEKVETVSRTVDKFIEVSIQPEEKTALRLNTDPKDKIEKSLQKDTTISPLQILSFLWIAGVILLVFYTVINNYRIYRRICSKSPVMSSESIKLFNQCRKSMNISRSVQLYESAVINVPVLYGFFKSYILLPSKFINSLTKNDLKHIFLHELAHLKHYDNKIIWVMTILQIFHWFNPVIWYAFFRMSSDRELACDELTLTNLGEKSKNEYGNTLISLLEHISLSQKLPISVKIIDDQHGLKKRINKIVNFQIRSKWWSILAVSVLIVLANISLTDANPGDQDSKPTASEVLLKIENNATVYVDDNLISVDSLLRYLNKFTYDANSLITILPEESIEVQIYYKILHQLQSVDVPRLKYVNNNTGESVITPHYQFETIPWDTSLVPKKIDGKYGFINRDREIVITPTYERVGMFEDGLAPAKLNDKWGFINIEGIAVLDFVYEYAGSFREERAEVKIDEKYGFLNRRGEMVIKPEYDHVHSFVDGLAPVEKNGRWGFINKNGELKIQFQYERAGEFQEGLAAVKLNNKWGFIDVNGQIVIDVSYESTGRFQNGRALIKKNDKYGFIDHRGALVIKPQYNQADEFSEGFAAVSMNGKYGFIDVYGSDVIKPQYDFAIRFMHGVGRAIIFEYPELGIEPKTIYLDKAGNILSAGRRSQ